jgi:hypothetical protein
MRVWLDREGVRHRSRASLRRFPNASKIPPYLGCGVTETGRKSGAWIGAAASMKARCDWDSGNLRARLMREARVLAQHARNQTNVARTTQETIHSTYRFNALMTPMRAIMVGPLRSATRISRLRPRPATSSSCCSVSWICLAASLMRILASAIVEKFVMRADGELEPATAESSRPIALMQSHAGIASAIASTCHSAHSRGQRKIPPHPESVVEVDHDEAEV